MSEQDPPVDTVTPRYSIDQSYQESLLRYAWTNIRPGGTLTSDEDQVLGSLLRVYERQPLDAVVDVPTKQNVVGIAFADNVDHQGVHSDWYDHHVTTLTPTSRYQEPLDTIPDPRRPLERHNIVPRAPGETLDDAINKDGGSHAALVNQQLRRVLEGDYDRRVIPVSRGEYRCVLAYTDDKPGVTSHPVRLQ